MTTATAVKRAAPERAVLRASRVRETARARTSYFDPDVVLEMVRAHLERDDPSARVLGVRWTIGGEVAVDYG